MKKLSMLGIIGGAALLTAAPFSLQWSQKNVALSLDSADARIGRPGTALSVAGVHRRAYRRAARSTVYGRRRRRRWLRPWRVLRRLWLSGLFLFRTVRPQLRNWLRLWVVLRRLRLSGLLHRTLQLPALLSASGGVTRVCRQPTLYSAVAAPHRGACPPSGVRRQSERLTRTSTCSSAVLDQKRSSVMNSRRLIRSPRRPARAAWATARSRASARS